MTESGVRRPVLGFSLGTFSTVIEKRALSASTSTVWVLRVSVGSAQISSCVASGPMPASDTATATLRLAGKPAAASRADPEKIFSGSVIAAMSMSFSTR
ncbi:MAG: hypothetical protein AcusKO_39230 [Acuticoccus sp.]